MTDKPLRGRPFQPGQSGNPGGRPKMPDDLKNALRLRADDALAVLVEVMADPAAPHAARVAAANAILDRGYGKPTQDITAKVQQTDLADAHLEALRSLSSRTRDLDA